ncbi:hypothetical protein J5N97_009937 [Dioscorea zingiberensis]|uniref:Uncharacterized protein n=1 Tax=Dioscorea zingiberensis TaxID=325984 RepID=A0A9D5CZ86_9LILI|nr:hypothetical protein J5N97_009937 [Dioscorea zingiberensis]
MGDLLAELEHVLRSEGMSREEAKFFNECKDRAIKDFTVGACVSSAIAWIASKSLVPWHRFSLSAGSGMLSGMWWFNRSLDASVNQILARDWDRMKMDLAGIIMKKHMHNPSRAKLLRKHMYPEEVFNDLNPDSPFTLWRFRNLYIEGNDLHKLQYNEVHSYKKSGSKEQPKQLMGSQGSEMIADPLDCIFGDLECSSEISHSDNVGKRSRRRRLHGHKRAHRHHNHHHQTSQTENFGKTGERSDH